MIVSFCETCAVMRDRPATGEQLGLLPTATVGEVGWADPTQLHEIGKTEEGAD